MPRTKRRTTKRSPERVAISSSFDGTADPVEPTTAGERPRGDKIPAHIFRARVDQIRSAIIAGASRADVLAIVAKMPAKNKARIAKAKRERKPAPDTSVWGTNDPPSPRTVARYMSIARKSLEKTGRKLPTMGEQIIGIQWARINMLFHAALQRERYHVCARLIEHTSTIFGLNGAIKLQILPGSPEPEPQSDVPIASQTEAGALYEMRALLATALKRARNGGDALAPIATKHGAQN